MLKIVMDPDFQALVAEDEMTTDGSKGTISAGWEEMYVEDGKIVNVEEGKSVYPPFIDAVKVGAAGESAEAPAELNF